jgi:hypothetical protein
VGLQSTQHDVLTPVVARPLEKGPGAELIAQPLTRMTAHSCRAWWQWFVENPSPRCGVGGYWLASYTLWAAPRRSRLARILIALSGCAAAERRDLRQAIPTAGISEKQALILPAVLRALAEPLSGAPRSSSIVRLAHNRGTLDKLGVLPEASSCSCELLARWTGYEIPVLVLRCGHRCYAPGSAMYRISETGTVADFGLMAASILAMQAAAPLTLWCSTFFTDPLPFRTAEEAHPLRSFVSRSAVSSAST